MIKSWRKAEWTEEVGSAGGVGKYLSRIAAVFLFSFFPIDIRVL